MKLIDTHCHFLTTEYVNAIRKYIGEVADGFPTPEWSLEKHLEFMELVGVSHSVLSLSTPHQHFGDDVFSAELTRSINEYAADMKKKYPDKFSYVAALPLPNVEMALKEAEYCLESAGACGVKIASQSNGLYLGDEKLDPLMEYLDQKKTVIIIHPSKPQAVPEGCYTSGPIPLMEFINDTTRAVVNMLANGTLEKYPNIKVLVPHCGSFLPNIIDRLVSITQVLSAQGIGKKVDVKKGLESLYFDIAGDAFPRGIKILQTLTDADHIVFGGDYPYTPVPLIVRKKNDMDAWKPFDAFREKIYYLNAEKLFSLGK